jgi:hypothetical protein
MRVDTVQMEKEVRRGMLVLVLVLEAGKGRECG